MLIFLGAAAVSLLFAFLYLVAGRASNEFDWTLVRRIKAERLRVSRQVKMISRVPTHRPLLDKLESLEKQLTER